MDEYLKDELESLRDLYITATPRQRRNIIEQRINNPKALPNLFVTRIAAIESLARTLVMNSQAKTKTELREIYQNKYRFRKVENMIREYLRINGFGAAPDVFGEESWKVFRIAVEYRNLLVHECTYLASQKFEPMNQAIEHVLNTLTKLAKLKVKK